MGAGGGAVPLRARRRIFFLVLGLTAYGLFALLKSRPGSVLWELVVVPGAAFTSVLGRISAPLPLPLAELLLLLLLLRWGLAFALDVGRARRARESLWLSGTAGGLRVAGDLGVLMFLFYVLWGFGYAAPPLEDRIEMAEAGLVEAGEVRALAREMVDAANREYLRIHGSPDAGAPTSIPSSSLLSGLDAGWEAAARETGLEALGARRLAPPKTLLLASPLRRVGISGMYVPFTGEALVLGDLPAVALGKAMAHEAAHQRGVAHEADANFLGFLAASRAADPFLRYSAYVFAQRQLLDALARADPEAREMLMGRRLPGVQRDLEDLRNYWARVEGPATRVGTRVNHAYLRQQGVPEGVASYGGSLAFLLRYARGRDGTLLPPEEARVERASLEDCPGP